MHLNRIDLNLFVVLDAIYSEGGITPAAKKLHLTQPAISHALGRLREMFGDPLFEREGRTMVPTPLARRMIEPLRRTLRSLEITLNEVSQFDPATSDKRFTVAVRDVLESTLLPAFMQRVTQRAPKIEIAVVRANRRDLESELAMGTIDAAMDVPLPLSDQVHRQRVALDPLMVVARQSHPRVTRRKLSLVTYLQQDHILVSSRRSGPGLEDVELSRQGLQRRIRLRCQHYFSACRVVSQTDLILTMPGSYARVASRFFDNQVLPLPFPMPAMDAYLYWHANADTEPANRWLREQLMAAFTQEMITKPA
ncbi:MAG: LysR family transcriptional regulator [Nevskiaceae bacterium]|nr:MAG: LysR family transcriptional regulator [Nevskiaceae bacterium]